MRKTAVEISMKALVATSLVLAMSLVACKQGVKSGPGGQALDSQWAGQLAGLYSQSVNGTIASAGATSTVFSKISTAPIASCVSITNDNPSDNDGDSIPVLRTATFTCPTQTGVVQLKDTDDMNPLSSFQVLLNNFQSQGTAGSCSIVHLDNRTTTIGLAGGGLNAASTFDTTTAVNSGAFRMIGSSNHTISPTNLANPAAGGNISLSSTFSLIASGNDMGTFTATSVGLRYSSCGLDSGTYQLVGSGHTLLVQITGCGMWQVTDNGMPLSGPAVCQ